MDGSGSGSVLGLDLSIDLEEVPDMMNVRLATSGKSSQELEGNRMKKQFAQNSSLKTAICSLPQELNIVTE